MNNNIDTFKTSYKYGFFFDSEEDYRTACNIIMFDFEHKDNTVIGLKFDTDNDFYWICELHTQCIYDLDVNIPVLRDIFNQNDISFSCHVLPVFDQDLFTPHVNHSSVDEDEHCPVTAKVGGITRATNKPSYKLSNPVKRWRRVELPKDEARRLKGLCDDLHIKCDRDECYNLIGVNIYCDINEEEYINKWMDENF